MLGLRSARRVAVTMGLACVCLGLSGCLFIGASTEKNEPSPTIGQELVDLKAAQEKGAISNEEYDCAKRKLLSTLPRE